MQDGIKCLERSHVQEIHYYKALMKTPVLTPESQPHGQCIITFFWWWKVVNISMEWRCTGALNRYLKGRSQVDTLPQNQNRGMNKLNTQNGSTCIKMNTLTRRSIGHPKSPENPHQYRCKDITVQRQNDPSPQQTLRGVPACLSFSGRTERLSSTQVDQRTGASRAEGMILYWIKWEFHPPMSTIMILGKLVNNNRFSYSLTTPNHLSASSYKAPRRCRSCSSITAWFVIRDKRQEELREEIE